MDTNYLGRSPDGSGYSAEPEPSCTVSAVTVSIPNAVLRLAAAIRKGREQGKLALYFGCIGQAGHYLHHPNGGTLWQAQRELEGFPWSDGLMDAGLLRNGKRKDVCDGKVYWTAGGLPLWYAFYWWDRSGDSRGASNSGFYVRGFGWPEAQDAFDYACRTFPKVVARQAHPLTLQDPAPASADTLPQGQDAQQGLAGTESGAVPAGQTPKPSRGTDKDKLVEAEAWKIFKSRFIPGSDEMDLRNHWDRNPKARRECRAAALRSHAQPK